MGALPKMRKAKSSEKKSKRPSARSKNQKRKRGKWRRSVWYETPIASLSLFSLNLFPLPSLSSPLLSHSSFHLAAPSSSDQIGGGEGSLGCRSFPKQDSADRTDEGARESETECRQSRFILLSLSLSLSLSLLLPFSSLPLAHISL